MLCVEETLSFCSHISRTGDRSLRHSTSLLAVKHFQESSQSAQSNLDLPVDFDREFFEAKYREDGTLNRRWTEFLKETGPFVQQAVTLWTRGQLRRDDPRLAESARQTLTNLGPAFVKLGQILSVREDILGEVWSAELAKLQNSVSAFGGPEAVEEALSNEIRKGLLSFDDTPIAVASIAQVHKGIWQNQDGTTTEVAIKVLRPNVASQVGVDLCVLLRAGGILSEWVPRILPVSRVDWEALLAGLAKGLWEEVDLSGEAQRQIRFATNMEPVPRVFVPEVVAYNRDILISEWVDGTPLREIPGMDIRLKEAQALMRDSYCKAMYVDAFFHADGHGGNLLWVEASDEKEGELCILDCGLMVDIEQDAAEGLLRLSLHLAARDWTRLVDDIIDLGFLPQDLSPQLRSEARGIARRIIGPYLDVGGGAKAASAYSISSLFDDVSAATLKLPTALPPDMILLARAVIQLEGLALRAYPDYRLVDDILPVAARIALRSDSSLGSSEARSSLLHDLLYETNGDAVFRGSGETFSFDKLLNLLDTATGSQNQAESAMSIDRLFDELVKADAARDLIAEEALNIGDAMVRDALWRSIDTIAERSPRLPLFVQPPFLPTSLSVLEKVAPRISETEQLVLVRLQEVLEDLDDEKSEPLSTPFGRSLPFEEFPIYKMLTLPGVRKSLGNIATRAVWNREESARDMAEAITEKLRARVETRLRNSGLVEPEIAAALSNAVFLPKLGQASNKQ